MQSSSFRLVWAIVTLVLLGALALVVRLAWVNNPTTAALPPTPAPTATIAATFSAQPPTATATVAPSPVRAPIEMGNVQRISAAGFAFRPPLGYSVEIVETGAILRNDEGAGFDATLLLSSAAPDALPPNMRGAADALAEKAVEAYEAERGSAGAPTSTLAIDGVDGVVVELETGDIAGQVLMMEPAPGRFFTMLAVASAEHWPQLVPVFDAIAASVSFFAPVVTPTTPMQPPPMQTSPPARATPTPTAPATTVSTLPAQPQPAAGAWRSYTNANYANAVVASLNTIWVATDGGVAAWNKNSGTYTQYTTLNGLTANRTTDVVNCPLRGFGIVFGSGAGLQIFDPQRSAWRALNSSNSGMSFDDVAVIHCDSERRHLVVGYKQHGVDILDANTGVWRYVGQNDGLQNNLVEALAVVGNREALWVSSGLGISVLTDDGQAAFYDEATSALETNQIRRMVVDEAGAVWLGAQDALYRFADDRWTIYDQRSVLASSFPGGAISGLALDGEGGLWVGSSRGEICHFDPVRVQCRAFYRGEPGMVAGELTSLTLGADGALYYTTAGGGVSMFVGGRWRSFVIPDEPLLGNEIHSLTQDNDGNVWIATERGIQAINPATDGVVRQFTRDESSLSSSTKEVLHASPDGGIWFGALGVSYFNGFSWTSYTIAEGLAGSLVQAIATDSQGRTWFGTESGLSIWNGSTFFNLTRENGLPSDNIIALRADGDTMWISAAGGGLFRFEKNQIQLFSPENSELPAGVISALAVAGDGGLLVGHSRGLARFHDGEVTPVDELTGVVVHTIATTADGKIWVGSNGDGVFYFDGANWGAPPGNVAFPAQQITNILVDENGSVWIGARTGGLLRYDP